jgi:hypothetical protein
VNTEPVSTLVPIYLKVNPIRRNGRRDDYLEGTWLGWGALIIISPFIHSFSCGTVKEEGGRGGIGKWWPPTRGGPKGGQWWPSTAAATIKLLGGAGGNCAHYAYFYLSIDLGRNTRLEARIEGLVMES